MNRRCFGHTPVRRLVFCLVCLGCAIGVMPAPASKANSARMAVQDSQLQTSKQDSQQDPRPEFDTVSHRGEVVWLSDALDQRYGIEIDPDAHHQQVALATDDGLLIPLVKDFRGRGFHLDERLRDVPMELQLRIFKQSPVAQIVQVYTVHDGAKFELDYWCDVCAIPMYELKACECCQGPTRLRERQVDE